MTSDAILSELPLFPLPNTVFFPKTVLPLYVFEPRYRSLVADALKGNGFIGVPLLKPGYEPHYAGCPEIYPVFGYGKLIESEKLEEGQYNIILKGIDRVRLIEEISSCQPYRIASVEILPDPDEAVIDPLLPALTRIKESFFPLLPFYEKIPKAFRDCLQKQQDPALFCHLIAMHLIGDCAKRQQLLELPTLAERIQALEKWMGEQGLHRCGGKAPC
ncbi:MAG: LON peptidase substrate-binding domain-containing protein [bacterium]